MTNFTKNFIKQLEDLRKIFIWNGRRPQIKHSTLIGDHVDGGYKDVDIETKLSSLRTIWNRRCLDNSFHAWKAIPYLLQSDIVVTSIFHFNYKPSVFCAQRMTHLPQFPFAMKYLKKCCIFSVYALRRKIYGTISVNYYRDIYSSQN